MARLTTIPEDDLSPLSDAALKPVRIKGQLSSVYLEIANSQAALNAYLAMEKALKSSSLSGQEIEAIKLLVSEKNQCDYCLSVHNFKAGAAGLDENQKLAIRRGESIGQLRIDSIVATVQTFFDKPGPLSESQMESLRTAGFTDGELVDIALAVSTIFFTNIFNHVNDTQSSLPAAPGLSDC